MPAVTWNQLNDLPDVLANDRFQLLVSPTANSDGGRVLALRLQQVSVPEEMIEPMLVQLQGFELSYPGRHTFDKIISCNFVETVDGAVSASIGQWMQRVRGTASGNSAGYKTSVSTTGTLNVFDTTGNPSLVYTIDNCWPSQAPQTQLDGSQTAPYLKQIQFTYDRYSLDRAPPQ